MVQTVDLTGRVFLVTGASGGLGQHFSRLLAGAGAHIAACGRRVDKLDEVVTEIGARGGRAIALEMDVTDCASIEAAVKAAESAFGPVEVLVNNSGTSLAKGAVEVSHDEYDRVMDTNPRGAFFTASAVARRMIAHGISGSIINISSVAATRPMAERSVYCMSKAAIDHMTRVLALEWAKHGIRVNAIAPGWLATPDNVALFERDDYKAYLAQFPRRRLGRPGHLDGALLLLASDLGDFITGQSILVDDGYSIAL